MLIEKFIIKVHIDTHREGFNGCSATEVRHEKISFECEKINFSSSSSVPKQLLASRIAVSTFFVVAG
jgi:hypothetical protein